MAQYIFPNSDNYIKYREENVTPLSLSEMDDNFQRVANQWTDTRDYEEGDIVYYAESDGAGSPQHINWYRCTSTHVASGAFSIDNWMLIGSDASKSGEPIIFNFPNFTLDLISAGDLVSIDDTNIFKASTDTPESGSNSVLGIYLGNQQILYRGFYTLIASSINGTWFPGQILYAWTDGKISTVPPDTIDYWVRSVGFCYPNDNSELKIYFDPETNFSVVGQHVSNTLNIDGILSIEDIGNGQVLITTSSGDLVLNGSV